MSQDIEVFFPVRILVRIVRSDAPAWEVFYCSFVEAVCEFVGFCLAFAGVAAPAGGVHPLRTIAGGVDVDADKNNIRLAEGLTVFICSADAFFERDVVFFRYQEFCIIATILEIDDDSSCDFSGIDCFEKLPVWGAFAFG